jgi:hypothetical protein
VTVRV